MPAPSPTTTTIATTSIWPPDWSAFLPDLIVALVTGAAVGVFVILAERWLSKRAATRETMRAQTAAANECAAWAAADVRYSEESFLPQDAELQRIETRIAKVPDEPASGGPSQFAYLREMIVNWDAMKVAVLKIEPPLRAEMARSEFYAEGGQRVFRRYIHSAFEPRPADGEKPLLWEAFWESIDAPTGAENADLIRAVQSYLRARVAFTGYRAAYLKVRETFQNERADAIVKVVRADPKNRLQRWRLERTMKAEVKDAVARAQREGYRTVRTVEAKARHRLEDIFGRVDYHDSSAIDGR